MTHILSMEDVTAIVEAKNALVQENHELRKQLTEKDSKIALLDEEIKYIYVAIRHHEEQDGYLYSPKLCRFYKTDKKEGTTS